MLILWPHGGKIMSSIKNISASNPVPNDLAKRLGNDGIGGLGFVMALQPYWQ